jgi:hypothetical protein
MLPKLTLEINGRQKQYVTARYSHPKIEPLVPNYPFYVKEDVPGASASSGSWWRWACTSTGGVCYARSQDSSGNYYILPGTQVWVDGNLQDADTMRQTPLTIMDLERSSGCPSGNCFFVRIVYLDPTAGDINPYVQTVNPTTGLKEGQGLQGTYAKDKKGSTNTVRRDESPSQITTTGRINNQVTVKRTVVLNDRSMDEFNSTVSQTFTEKFPP